ncbi:hypothetical protein HY989_05670 [Candidatus Micrarchaeota archaeon]|nr:hypothetical protein [Candidatus Micrarchaeota archaeon]
MVTIESTPNETRKEVVLRAFDANKKQVGTYRLHIHNYLESGEAVVWGFMHSKKEGAKIPKALIKEAQNQLVIMAKKSNLQLIHQVGFRLPVFSDKLKKHFTEHGYLEGKDKDGDFIMEKRFECKPE